MSFKSIFDSVTEMVDKIADKKKEKEKPVREKAPDCSDKRKCDCIPCECEDYQ